VVDLGALQQGAVMHSDCTLLESACQLPGARVVDVETGEIIERRGGTLLPQAGGVPLRSVVEGSSLSTLHICGKDNYCAELTLNGGLLAVRKPVNNEAPIGGKRGKISGFSRSAGRRMQRKMARIDREKMRLPLFVTLTYPAEFPSELKTSKIHLHRFVERLVYRWSDSAIVWRLEPQRRGAPHFHMMIYGVSYADLRSFVPQAWFEIAGGGDPNHLLWHLGKLGNQHCVTRVKSWRGVRSYVSKYMTKPCDCEGWDNPGRFWGIYNRDAMQWSPVALYDGLTRQQVVNLMRYMRRYAHLKGRDYSGLTIFINNPEQWEKLLE